MTAIEKLQKRIEILEPLISNTIAGQKLKKRVALLKSLLPKSDLQFYAEPFTIDVSWIEKKKKYFKKDRDSFLYETMYSYRDKDIMPYNQLHLDCEDFFDNLNEKQKKQLGGTNWHNFFSRVTNHVPSQYAKYQIQYRESKRYNDIEFIIESKELDYSFLVDHYIKTTKENISHFYKTLNLYVVYVEMTKSESNFYKYLSFIKDKDNLYLLIRELKDHKPLLPYYGRIIYFINKKFENIIKEVKERDYTTERFYEIVYTHIIKGDLTFDEVREAIAYDEKQRNIDWQNTQKGVLENKKKFFTELEKLQKKYGKISAISFNKVVKELGFSSKPYAREIVIYPPEQMGFRLANIENSYNELKKELNK